MSAKKPTVSALKKKPVAAKAAAAAVTITPGKSSNDIYPIAEEIAEEHQSEKKGSTMNPGDIPEEQEIQQRQSRSKQLHQSSTNDKDSVTSILDTLQNKLHESELQCENLTKEVQQLTEENGKMKVQLDALNKQMQDYKNPKNVAFLENQVKQLKESEAKLKKEVTEQKVQAMQQQKEINIARTDANKFEKMYLATSDAKTSLENAIIIKENQIKTQNDKIAMMQSRNRDLELASVDVNKKAEHMYKEKREMEMLRDQIKISLADSISQNDILKRENTNLSQTLQERNKVSNDKISDHIAKITEQAKEIAELKQERVTADRAAAAAKMSRDELRVELKLINAQVSENEEMRKKLTKKDEKIEELEDYIDKLKDKLRMRDTVLTIRDQYGQVREYHSEKYSDLLDKKQQDEMDGLKKDLIKLQENMEGFRTNSYKLESEKESLRVEVVSLREEVKRLERMRAKETNEYEEEIRDKLRSQEAIRLRMIVLQEENEKLQNTKEQKMEILRDTEFLRQEGELKKFKERTQQLETQVAGLEAKIDHLNQTNNKRQMILGDMYFQNENLKEEVEYLTQMKQTNIRAKATIANPLKDKQNEQYFEQQQQSSAKNPQGREQHSGRFRQSQQQGGSNSRSQFDDMEEREARYEDPTHYERDSYANFYRDSRQVMDSQHKYQSTSTVASQSYRSPY